MGLRAVEEQAHGRDVVGDVELRVRELGHAGPVSHRAVGSELDADDVLDAQELAAPHADRFGDLAHVLADARARDFIGRKPVAPVLAEQRVIGLRAIPVGRTRRRRARPRHSPPAAIFLRQQRTGSKQRRNRQTNHSTHLVTSSW